SINCTRYHRSSLFPYTTLFRSRFKNNKYLLLRMVTLIFMLFGAFFGIFEESMALLPILIILSLSMGWDTLTGIGMCLLAAGFGLDRKSTRLNSSHVKMSYAVFC